MTNKKFGLAISLIFGIFAVSCASTPKAAPTSFEGFWTMFDLSEYDADPPEDWELLRDGSLVITRIGAQNNLWKQEGNEIIISINDSFATYILQIVDDNLLRGRAVNLNYLEWPVELRRIQNPVTLKNESTGALAVLGLNGYFILDSATILYQNLSEDKETWFMMNYMTDDNGDFYVLGTSSEADANVYMDLIKYYTEDKTAWGFDVSQQKGSAYLVNFNNGGKNYDGVVANFSFMDEMRYYVVPRE
jgi:hypothetical protein